MGRSMRGAGSKGSMSQIFLVSLALMATVPALVLGYLWISDQQEHFNWQVRAWQEDYLEMRERALEREVDAAIDYIVFRRDEMQQDLRRELRRRVDNGISVISSLHAQHRAEPRERLLERVYDLIQPIRFDGNVHYFVHTLDGRGVLHPADRSWEGRDIRDETDPEGFAVVAEMLALAHGEGQGFLGYWSPKPGVRGHYRTLSYLRVLPELGVYVGASVYMDDAVEAVQDEVRERFARASVPAGNPMLFITSFDGIQQVNTWQPHWRGRHLGNLHDAEGQAVFPSLLGATEHPEGEYLSFSWRGENASEPLPALVFVRGFDEWRWLVGAGVFLDELEALLAEQRAVLQERSARHMLFIAGVVVALIALAVLVAHWLSRLVQDGFDSFRHFFADASQHSASIDVGRLPFSEFEEVAGDANRMIAEQARHEQAIKLNEQRFKMALDASRNHLWDLDMQRGVVSFSPAFYRLLGFRHIGAEHRLQNFSGLCHPDDRLMVAHAIANLDAEFSGSGLEFRMRGRDGRYRWFFCRGDVVERTADGRPQRALGTITDISSRKRMEEELVAARIAAEDANHAKSQFLSSISHELRTPLNGVLGYAQVLLRDRRATPEQRLHLESIESCGQHLLTLINDVLDLAKIESGNLEVAVAACDLQVVLAGVDDIMRQRAESKGLGFRLGMAEDVPRVVLMDEVKLRQILVNLLSNAVKFSQEGGVELLVECGPGGAELLFRVRDTGVGIAPERLRDIFQPFRQAGTSDASGTGLGLAISLRLCEAMDGTLEVDSTPGQGSCFTVSLPLHRVEGPALPPQRAAGVTRASLDPGERELTILVADDNGINRQVLAGMLRTGGVRILEAANGREVLQLLRSEDVALVLMDARMPELDGAQTTRALRRDAKLRDVVVIGISASVMPEVIAEMRAAGCDDFIGKPVRVEELLEKIRLHLGTPLRTEPARDPAVSGDLAELPAALLAELEAALAVGDVDALERWLLSPELATPGRARLHAQLEQLVRGFELDGLRELLATARRSGPRRKQA